MEIFLLILGIVFWTSGYLTARNIIMIKESAPYWRRFINVPRWLFYLCGAPESTSHPAGSIMARVLGLQIMGIAIVVFASINLIWQIDLNWSLFGFGVSVLVPYLIVYYYSKITDQ
ncbi:MAG: hypothetical protein HFACDABA_02743 [Anaerolineales bacterium]|nr:hypothetical protein [Anaerolineales bacterium]